MSGDPPEVRNAVEEMFSFGFRSDTTVAALLVLGTCRGGKRTLLEHYETKLTIR